MTKSREPSRYRPHFGGKPDPTRCVASISHGRVTFSQCSKPRLPDSEWCSVHKPVVADDDAPLIYVVEDTYAGDLKLETAKIVKETPKQIKLEDRAGSGFGYRTTLAKDETTGELEFGARTAIGAVERYLADKERELLRAEEVVARARGRVEEAKLFLEETKKGHTL